MNILAVETSCDETSIAVVRDGRHILSNVIASQIDLHRKYGGVVPELASRQHVLTVIPVLEEALQRARFSWVNIDAIAVTRGPGLSPALLVGVNAAKGMAFARQKPLLAVNHIEGHVYSNWLIPEAAAAAGTPPPEPKFPALCLRVSGGHTELMLMTGHGHYKLLGKTIDDAAGEAFDKAARILGLGYPGGPAIQKAAEEGNPARFPFPRAWLKGTYDFSFSGLKTALLRKVQEYGVTASKPAPWQRDPQPVPTSEGTGTMANESNPEGADRAQVRLEIKGEGAPDISSYRAEPAKTTHLPPPPESVPPTPPPVPTPEHTDSIMDRPLPVADLAASFQAAAVDALVEKTVAAAAEFGAREVLVAGGVAANAALRTRLGERLKIPFRYPPLVLCTDNAAMIAAAAYYRYAESVQRDFTLDIEPNARFV
ncbi:MAG TPA: tRNA (adenosine(37)-N6)-threonylcarbamoyltransferase complex transferase subunit TsaD [Chloroflexia bacterium]|nr:tRNA (adenosine(37)-N6)-threonylcarbamoyltransferase complex transferase subunit TsaD [Chloroflexia bacterium]